MSAALSWLLLLILCPLAVWGLVVSMAAMDRAVDRSMKRHVARGLDDEQPLVTDGWRSF